MIYNDPYEKRRLTYSHVWWNEAFDNYQLDLIEEYCSQQTLEESRIVGDVDVRQSQVKFITKNEDTAWVFDTFNNVIDSLNQQFYGFDLYGYNSFQYTTYKSEVLGRYDWHMDTILDQSLPQDMMTESTRKLTLVMALNEQGKDYTGGEFQLNLGSEETPTTLEMTRGKIYAFPSFLIHRVKPVLTGTRKSIVIWVEGPKFV